MITAAGMLSKYVQQLGRLSIQQATTVAEAEHYSSVIMLSLFQAIVDEIQQNSTLIPTTTDTHGAIVAGKVM